MAKLIAVIWQEISKKPKPILMVSYGDGKWSPYNAINWI